MTETADRQAPSPARQRLVLLRAGIQFFVAVAAAVAWLSLCYAQPQFPALSGRIVDEARLLGPEATARISDKLAALERETTIQFVVATVRSLQGYEIRDFGYRLGRHWALGREGENNGILLLVAPDEREVSIEVGYGLESVMTDATSKLILENAILPAFRQGDFALGIETGVDDVIAVVTGGGEQVMRRLERSDAPRAEDVIFPVIFLLVAIYLIIRSLRGQPIGPGGSRSSSRTSSGGSRSSGGFRGGGGSFGGGGASGRW